MAEKYHQDLERLFKENMGLRRREKVLVFTDVPHLSDSVGRRRRRCAAEAVETAAGMAGEARLVEFEEEAVQRITEGLRAYRDRIRIVLPKIGEIAALTALFTLQA